MIKWYQIFDPANKTLYPSDDNKEVRNVDSATLISTFVF
jgi:hypothetical protein